MLEAALAALFGLLIGSFLNVCIYRLPRDLSVVYPRSFCPGCEQPIAWYDNVPLFSYLILRARCRHCRAPIPFRYPLVEFLTAALFFASVAVLGPNFRAIKLSVFSALIVALIFADLEERILPDEFTLGGAVVGFLLSFLVRVPGLWPQSWLNSLFAALLLSGLLWLIGVLYKKVRKRDGLGLGDVKMVAMIGAFLGLQGVLLTLMAGSLLGALLGILYIMVARKDAASYELPFGSFLGAAALLVAFWGEVVVRWWSGLGA